MADFEGLRGDLDRALRPPSFDDVLAAGRRAQRRRRAAGVVAVVVLTAGASAAVAALDDPGGAQTPVDPATSPTVSPDRPVDGDIDPTVSSPLWVDASASGALLTVWETCLDRCRVEYAVRDGDRTVLGDLDAEPLGVAPVGDGWLLTFEDGRRTRQVLLEPGGELTPVDRSSRAVATRPGDVAVGGAVELAVFRPADLTVHPVATSLPVVQSGPAYVTGAGVVVVPVSDGNRHGYEFVDDGVVGADGTLASLPPGAGVVVGNGEVTAIVDEQQPRGGSARVVVYVAERGVELEARATLDPPLPDYATVTPTGVVLGIVDGTVLRILEDGTVAPTDVEAQRILGAGDLVYAQRSVRSAAPLLVSDDDGETWTEVPLPGTG